MEKGDVRVGAPLTTFLVYAGPDATHLDQLNASLVVPMVANVPINPRTGLPGPLTGSAAGALRADSAVLGLHRACSELEDNARCVPVTIQAGANAKLCFSFTPPIAQDYNGQVTLATNDPSETGPVVQLSGQGQ